MPPSHNSRWEPFIHTFAIEPDHSFVSLWNSSLEELTMSFVRGISTWISVDVLDVCQSTLEFFPNLLKILNIEFLYKKDFLSFIKLLLLRLCLAH